MRKFIYFLCFKERKMDPKLRDLFLYYYDHRSLIKPQKTNIVMRRMDDKDGLWIKKDNDVLAILPSGKVEWNGRPLTSYQPKAIAILKEFVDSIRLEHQKAFKREEKKEPQQQYFDVLQQQHQTTILQELFLSVQRRDRRSGDLWDAVFASVVKDTRLTKEEDKLFYEIFKQLSTSREQSTLFLKSLSFWMRKRPSITWRFLAQLLPPNYFSRSVHKHRNWFPDSLRYWMTSVSPKEFEKQLSQYVKVESSPILKAQRFSDVSSILEELNNKIYGQQDNHQTMEEFFISLYRLIDPIDATTHYRYAADIIHEEMLNELMRLTRPEQCKGNVMEVMEYMRPGKLMTRHDFVRTYQALLDMKGCNSQKTMFLIAKHLFTEQLKRKCREKHVPMVSTEKIFQALGRFDPPMQTLTLLTPYFPQIRKIFKILGWIK